MTEQEYIMATDVRALDLALDALYTIIPENNPLIDGAKFGLIRSDLDHLRDSIRDAINVEAEE